MRIVASDQARELIAEQGGRLYVSIKTARCCGRAQTLIAATDPGDRTWSASDCNAGFELFLPATLSRRPAELHIEARRFPRRIEAYWDGCAWVM